MDRDDDNVPKYGWVLVLLVMLVVIGGAVGGGLLCRANRIENERDDRFHVETINGGGPSTMGLVTDRETGCQYLKTGNRVEFVRGSCAE